MAAAKNPVRGEKHHLSKLTDDDIKLLLACKAERDRLLEEAKKLTNKQLAAKFDIHERTVERVFYRGGWAHV